MTKKLRAPPRPMRYTKAVNDARLMHNLASLKTHTFVVCLWASAEVLWERVRHQTHQPLLQAPDPLARMRQLLAEREPFYRQADLLVNTEMRPVKEVALLVVQHFRPAQRERA